MLKNNYKSIFFFMMLPLYFNLIILLIGIQAGAIVWRLWFLDITINLIGAWLISYKEKLLINIIGFSCFLLKGGYWFSRFFMESIRSSHLWVYEVYIGSFILILGIIGFVYSIIKNKLVKKHLKHNV